nr:crosslink repair DNA glycosylase YcaQ family protein [Asanoa hainanensis]
MGWAGRDRAEGAHPAQSRRGAWWLGATKSVVREALDDLGAVRVSLSDGAVGFLRPDDLDPVAAPEPWVALLPLLDPTVMGWKGRAFYLGPHALQLFDSAGNAGTTAWIDGRVVGAWVQNPAGVVELRLLEEVPPAAHALLRAEARRLTEWLGGQRVFTVYPSPAMVNDSM